MRTLFLAVALALVASGAHAQTSRSTASSTRSTESSNDGLATASGHEVSVGVAAYAYHEPLSTPISIHGPKLALEYTGTVSLDERHWFVQAQAGATLGAATYDGFCSPFLIRPNQGSPNGYELGLGSPSPCSESGDADWYVEARGLVGKDVIRQRWAWSPYSGLGLRHLSNGTTGVNGYRTDDYLYVPLGVTARTRVDSRRILRFDVEFDVLAHGWQRTRDSELGGGDLPPTATAPAFTINSFTDVSFPQSRGWALRVGSHYPLTRRWSLQPYYVRWSVGSSPVMFETITFTVNGVTAREQRGVYEPFNVTHEGGIRLGVHF